MTREETVSTGDRIHYWVQPWRGEAVKNNLGEGPTEGGFREHRAEQVWMAILSSVVYVNRDTGHSEEGSTKSRGGFFQMVGTPFLMKRGLPHAGGCQSRQEQVGWSAQAMRIS